MSAATEDDHLRVVLGYIERSPIRAGWVEDVNAPMFETDLKAVRQCVQRNAPFGSEPWVWQTAANLRLQSSLGRRGNPHLGRRATDTR